MVFSRYLEQISTPQKTRRLSLVLWPSLSVRVVIRVGTSGARIVGTNQARGSVVVGILFCPLLPLHREDGPGV